MNRLYPMALGALLALGGCVSKVEREALSFPSMPREPVYQRLDGTPLSPDQTIDALESAESTCLKAHASAVPPIVGSAAFDACMRGEGYRRVQ
jgi:hypothetical protein